MNRGLLILFAILFCTAVAAQDPALYRTIDGTQNNLNNPEWGAAHTALLQVAGTAFSDGYASPAGADRPNARYISNTIFNQPELLPDPMTLSDYTWVFGQFMDHDIGLTEGTEEPFNIPVPQGDENLDPLGTGTMVIHVNRTHFMEGTGTEEGNPAQYANEITAFIDGSAVYGSDDERAAWLRSFEDGKLKVSAGNLLPYNTTDGEFDSPVDPNAPFMADAVGFAPRLFVAGDIRANENPLLMTFHTLFVREHNRRADIIKAENPDWSDEEIYQLARKYISGHIQAITYNEWLPAMGVAIAEYTGYIDTINAQLSNTFTAAAFRVGHTLLNSVLLRVDYNGNELPQGHMLLRNGFFNPTAIPEVGGIDPYLAGMGQQTQQSMDNRVVDDIRNFLFGPPGAGGTDLASINIQRGRDRGLPNFNAIRQAYGLPTYFVLEQINADVNVFGPLFQAYFGDINRVDPWVGMLAETPVAGSLFGETLLTILAQQFTGLRDGDRFFYLNDPVLTEAQKAEIDQTTFRDIVMHNTDITLMQDNVFLAMPYSDICGSATANVSGEVYVHTSAAPLPDVQLSYLLDGEPTIDLPTGSSGSFQFADLGACVDGTIQPTSGPDDQWINGVSVQDIVIISRHILGIELMESPYQLLAADADVNGDIGVTDIIAIRRLILDLDSELSDDLPMWNFIPASYEFTDPTAPWDEAYPDFLALPNPVMNLANQDFVAYKRGDVNATATINGNNFGGEEPLAGRDALLQLSADDIYLTAGTNYEVAFTLSGAAGDYQFALTATDRASFNEASFAASELEYLHLNERGQLRFCGNKEDGDQTILLTITAKRPGYLCEMIRFDGDLLPAVAISNTNPPEAGMIALDWQSSSVVIDSDILLADNQQVVAFPNPFSNQLTFTIPPQTKAGTADLMIVDMLGREVRRENRSLPVDSEDNWTLNVGDLPAGKYSYVINTPSRRYHGHLMSAGK